MAERRKINNPGFAAEDTMTDEAAEQAELAEGTEAGDTQQQATEQGQEAAATSETPPAEGATQEPPNKTGVVPYDRFKEVNDRYRATEKELNEQREKWARLDERTKQIKEAREQAERARAEAEQAAKRPDPALDPVGAELWDVRQQNQQLVAQFNQLNAQFQQQSQGLQQTTQQAEFTNWVNTEAERYDRQNPGYYDAATFAANKRMELWQKVGATPELARDIVARESFFLTALARQSGKSFAPIVVELAQNWGWQNPAAQNGNGAAKPAATGTAANNAQRLAQAQRGQAMQGLSRGSGGPAQAATAYKNYTPAQIAEMSDAEWFAVRKNPEKMLELATAIANHEGVSVDDAMSVMRDR